MKATFDLFPALKKAAAGTSSAAGAGVAATVAGLSLVALQEVLIDQGKPRLAGILLVEELEELSRLLNLKPSERPFVVVLGGAKVRSKSATMSTLLKVADEVLVGGALAYPFMVASQLTVGDSFLDPDDVPRAKSILKEAEALRKLIRLPCDHWTVPEINGKGPRTLQGKNIQDGLCGIDIGPETARQFWEVIRKARTVFWNGPMGLFDVHALYAAGTRSVAESIVEATAHGCHSVVGGGESASAVRQFGLGPEFSFVSTGGGAALHLLAGGTFKSIELLSVNLTSEAQ